MFRVLKGKSGIYPISSPNLLKCQFPANFWANPFPISSFLIFISSPRDPNPIFPMKNRQIRLSSQFTPRGPSTVNGPSLESIILCFLLFDFPFFVAGFFFNKQCFSDAWNPKCHGEKHHVTPNNLCSVIQYLSEVS